MRVLCRILFSIAHVFIYQIKILLNNRNFHTNSTITAKFESPLSISDCIFVGNNGILLSKGKVCQVGDMGWLSIAYGNGIYVIAGYSGYVAYSMDGMNWSTPKQIGTSVWQHLMFENGVFLLTATNSARRATSTNGMDWIEREFSYTPVGFGHGDGMFAANTYSGKVYLSNDGVSWNDAGTAGSNMAALAVSEKMILGYTSGGFAYKTTDKGKSWERSGYNNSLYPTKIIRGDGKFITAYTRGTSSSILGYIEDDLVPNIKSTSVDSSKKWIDMDFRNGKHAALSKDGYYSVSTDGINWSTPKLITDESGNPITATLNSICIIP